MDSSSTINKQQLHHSATNWVKIGVHIRIEFTIAINVNNVRKESFFRPKLRSFTDSTYVAKEGDAKLRDAPNNFLVFGVNIVL